MFRDGGCESPRVLLKGLEIISNGLELVLREVEKEGAGKVEFCMRALLFLGFYGVQTCARQSSSKGSSKKYGLDC